MNRNILALLGLAGILILGVASGFLTSLASPSKELKQETLPRRVMPVPVSPIPTQPTALMIHDVFERANQTFWGSAPDGQMWQGDAATNEAFSISGHTGLIAPQAEGAYNALIGPEAASANILVALTITNFGQQHNNVGIVLRYSDSGHFYKALFDGAQFRLVKVMGNTTVVLASMPFTAVPRTFYAMRFQAQGDQLAASVWQIGDPEPTSAQLIVTD